jgi:hypothetical protein
MHDLRRPRHGVPRMLTRNMRYRAFDAALFTGCSVGALYAAQRAVAAAPVEEAGWEGAKEALRQVAQEDAPAKDPPAPLRACYRPTTVHAVTGPVGALALYIGQEGDTFLWPVEGAIGVTVSDAILALGEASVLADLDPANVPACDPVEKVSLPAPPQENTP